MSINSTSRTDGRIRAKPWSRYIYKLIGKEVSLFSSYYDQLIQLSPPEYESFTLFESIVAKKKEICSSIADLPDLSNQVSQRTVLLLNGNFNYCNDIQGLLQEISSKMSRSDRITVVAYNPYFSWLYRLSNLLGLRKAPVPQTFLTLASLQHLARISGFEIVRTRFVGFIPFKLFGFGAFLNMLLPAIPGLRFLALTMLITLRPLKKTRCKKLSIIVPARNERGNIEGAITRLPSFSYPLEIIFVEGHSKDQTWEEILRVQKKYHSPQISIHAYQQAGKGKNDAVRLGFQKARGELLTILDADLTMPPELLHRFVKSWEDGDSDFINGSRLLYPMEGGAMRPLNLMGNIFFCKALSSVLGIRLSDTLCGTKLLERADYVRIERWREDFGDFDPFGDFEFLFGAAILCLGNVDIPIRYGARTYGTTNISRFTHGFMLLRMTLIGFFRVRMGAWK